MAIKIRPIENRDFPDWLPLWDGNNLGTRDEAVTTETWSRLTGLNSNVHGVVAEDNGKLVGLVHYVTHPTTGSINDACYMQDVYVDPAQRKGGIAKKMVKAVVAEGKSKKWSRLYWLAESDNEAAQALYKDFGAKLDFTLHVLPL